MLQEGRPVKRQGAHVRESEQEFYRNILTLGDATRTWILKIPGQTNRKRL